MAEELNKTIVEDGANAFADAKVKAERQRVWEYLRGHVKVIDLPQGKYGCFLTLEDYATLKKSLFE